MRCLCALSLVAVLLLGACFDGDDDEEGTAAPTASATPATTEVTGSATTSPAAECRTPRELTADEQQPSLDGSRIQGSVLDIDLDARTIYVKPDTGPPPSKPVTGLPVPQLQVQLTEDTRLLFSDGTPAGIGDLACGAEIAATGRHELRGRVVADVIGIIVPRAEPPPAALCPIAANACSFASQLARHVLEGDGEAVMSSSKSTFYECPGPDAAAIGPPFPLCEGAPAGEVRAGFPSTWGFGYKGGVVTEADVARDITEWSAHADGSLSDEFGDGAPRAYSIACTEVPADEGSKCGDEFSLIFSGLTAGSSSGESLGRWMLVVYVHRNEGELRAYRFESSVLDFTDPSVSLSYALEGGTGLVIDRNVPSLFAPSPEGAVFVTFFPWDPSALIN